MTKPLKIICFLFDPNVGGPTIRARAVYEKLIPEGYDVRIVFPDGEGTAKSYMAERDIPVDQLSIAKPVLPRKIIPFARFVLTAPISLWKVTSYLRRHRPDLIHVNGAFDVIPAMSGVFARVPVVWHLNDTVFGRGISHSLGALVRRVAKTVIVAATRVGQHYNVEAAAPHVIFAPVNIHRFKKQARPISDPPLLTLIGNWNWIKGHDRFVEVVRQLHRDGVIIKAEVVGKFLDSQETYWTPIVKDIQDSGLSGVIDTRGFVSDMVAVLEQTDLFLLTSHSEASPISLLEAMSMGVPAISFDVGGVSEMIGEGSDAAGIVVPEGDIGAMVAAVKKVIGDQTLYKEMSDAGRRRARENFSLEACVERHKMAYKAAVED